MLARCLRFALPLAVLWAACGSEGTGTTSEGSSDSGQDAVSTDGAQGTDAGTQGEGASTVDDAAADGAGTEATTIDAAVSDGPGTDGQVSLDGATDSAVEACASASQCDHASHSCTGSTLTQCVQNVSGCLDYSETLCPYGCSSSGCATGCLEWIYDASHAATAYLRANVAYSADSSVLGWIVGTKAYFNDGSLAGWADGDLIYDAGGSLAAKRTGTAVLDPGGAVRGFVDHGTVYDTGRAVVGFIEDPMSCHTETSELLVLVLLGPLPF